MKSVINFLKKRWKLILILVIVIGLALFFLNSSQQKNQIQYEEMTVERRYLVKTLELSGYLDAKEHANLSFIAGGRLVYLGAQEGDWVKKWQTIATIDVRDLQKTLNKTLNVYDTTRLNWEETERNDKDKALSEEEIRDNKQQQNTLENSVYDVELTSIAISNSVMSAPFEGILLSVPSNVTGVVLGPTSTFELVNPKTLIVRADVDEADVSLLMIGQKAELNFDAYPDEDTSTLVSFIALKSSQGSSGTVFKVELPMVGVETLSKYRLGMNADVYIELEKKENVLVLPIIAVETKDGQDMVKLKSEDKQGYREQVVELGLETDEAVEILSGLNENDIVLIEE